MIANIPSIKATCVKFQCYSCNCSLLVFKDDIKREIVNRKNEVFESKTLETINEFKIGNAGEIELVQQLDTKRKYTQDMWKSKFRCLACLKYQNMASNISYNNDYFSEEVSRTHNHYYIESDIYHKLKITDEQFEEMKNWSGKKLNKYLKEDTSEEQE